MTLATKLRHEAGLLPVNTPGNKALRERLLQLADEADVEPRGSMRPGQVYWNKALASYGVVFDVRGSIVRLMVLGVGRYNRGEWKRVTWKNGKPKTWELYRG